MWEPLERVSDPFVAGAGDPSAIAAVRVESRSNIPTFNTMGSPGLSVLRFHMDADFDARWGQWSAIEINRTIDLGPS